MELLLHIHHSSNFLQGAYVDSFVPPEKLAHLSEASARHHVLSKSYLWTGWANVLRVSYLLFRNDGTIQPQDRDLHQRGDGVTTLLHDPARGTVVLLKQPRIVASMRGAHSGETLEACSGLVGTYSAEESARREVAEETGYALLSLTRVATVYESPGGSLDLIHLFLGEYDSSRKGAGGGLYDEGEDIETLEMTLSEAMKLVDRGTIRDARSLLLLQHLALSRCRIEP